jgi:hypothetical protein
MVIGQTDNGDGTTTLSWAGASLPMMVEVRLEKLVGPGMYDSANGISLIFTPSTSASISNSAVDSTSLDALVAVSGMSRYTSAFFPIPTGTAGSGSSGPSLSDPIPSPVAGCPAVNITRLVVGDGTSTPIAEGILGTYEYVWASGYQFSEMEVGLWVGGNFIGYQAGTTTELPLSYDYAGAMIGAYVGEVRKFTWLDGNRGVLMKRIA